METSTHLILDQKKKKKVKDNSNILRNKNRKEVYLAL